MDISATPLVLLRANNYKTAGFPSSWPIPIVGVHRKLTCTSAGPPAAAATASSGTSDESNTISQPLYTLRLFSSRPACVKPLCDDVVADQSRACGPSAMRHAAVMTPEQSTNPEQEQDVQTGWVRAPSFECQAPCTLSATLIELGGHLVEQGVHRKRQVELVRGDRLQAGQRAAGVHICRCPPATAADTLAALPLAAPCTMMQQLLLQSGSLPLSAVPEVSTRCKQAYAGSCLLNVQLRPKHCPRGARAEVHLRRRHRHRRQAQRCG